MIEVWLRRWRCAYENISVRLFKSDKTPGRGYNLFDCFPVSYSITDRGPVVKEATETITVSVGRIELTTRQTPPSPGSTGGNGPNPHSFAEASVSDKFAQVQRLFGRDHRADRGNAT